ncbi:ATP-binding protein, partial [Luteitalea sp.]|uniref:PAS domain-containing hybrid sensor histidine kinase/response regulator n=1 Tax=Luteitalea sp. TaxID=2004800 RepID=UPI0037C80239
MPIELGMGPFRFVCGSLAGAFLFASLWQLTLWVRERAPVSLAAALHGAASGAYAVALLRLVDAGTVDEMQRAVDFRASTAMVLALTAVYLAAVFGGIRPRRPLAIAAAAITVTAAARWLEGSLGTDVRSIESLVVWGEPLAAPVRVAGPAHWAAAVIVGGVSCFMLVCGWRLRATDPVSGLLLLATAGGSLVSIPFVTVLQPSALPWQPLTVLPQLGLGLVGATVLAREHEARARAAGDAERLLRAVFDQTFQLVALLDLDGRVVDANAYALETVGLTMPAVVGVPFEHTQWWRDSPQRGLLREAIGVAAGGGTARFEALHTSTTGASFRVDFSIRPLLDEHGRVIRLIAEARDITEQVGAEEAHRRIDEQLHQAQKLEAVGQLAGGIAHDFNNLLTVINGFASLLGTAPEFTHRQAEIAQIQAASERAISLTRQLLTFSQHAVADLQVLHLDDLLRRCEPLVRRLVGPTVKLRLSVTPGTHSVKADPTQLERVVINLAVNARDAMPGGGALEFTLRGFDPDQDTVTLAAPADWTVLAVRDAGSGMPPEVRARLFEPFFTTKAPGKGTGLGLAVVDRIVAQARGLIDVRSRVGAGTTFLLYFPATQDAEIPADGAIDAPATGGTETILVVDDEPALLELAVAALAMRGYRVLQAGSPAQALDVAAAHGGRIDLLLSDVVMPGGSATVIVETLRERQPDLRVLFMSGYPADEAVRRGVVAGQANFLQKPFTPDGLAARVRHL